jgi:hypothetical protein
MHIVCNLGTQDIFNRSILKGFQRRVALSLGSLDDYPVVFHSDL